MKLLKYIYKQILNRKKRELLNYLQSLPEDRIEQLGFCATLVQQGISAWPWQEDEISSALAKIDQMITEEQHNVVESKSYTDSELHGIGMSQSLNKNAVRNGRVGIDDTATVKAA